MSVAALGWFLFRVIPKPIRATYPCQQAAFPLASALVIWLLGIKIRLVATCRQQAPWGRPLLMTAGLLGVLGLCAWGVAAVAQSWMGTSPGWTPREGSNQPMGAALGLYPGRVVWTHNPAVSTWAGTSVLNDTNFYHRDANTSTNIVASMFSQTLRRLTSQGTDAGAWDALFRSFNQTHGRGAQGYAPPETLAIKINLNNTIPGLGCLNRVDATPQVVRSLLNQLVQQAGVPQTNLIVFDLTRDVSRIRAYCTNAFPSVRFYGSLSGPIIYPAGTSIVLATNAAAKTTYTNIGLPAFLTNATYVINLALLKRHADLIGFSDWSEMHGQIAITCCFKNHFGCIGSPSALHTSIRDWSNGMGAYNALVDLAGSQHLGGKTLLYLIDGLYGGNRMDAIPIRWTMPPFSNGWPSSLLASQDPVAIDSVALDFLRTEWGVTAHADNFLHEAALADNPPSGVCYAPNMDGVRLSSLGVHEHWDGPLTKQYSRNLSPAGRGIELLTVHPGSGIAVALEHPIPNALFNPAAPIRIKASASSGYTRIRQVDFMANTIHLGTSTNSPYSTIWSNAPAGRWELTAVATDTDSLMATSAVVVVTVQSNDLTVALTNPTNGLTLAESSPLTLEATAASSQSTMRSVDFYANDNFLGFVTNSPYTRTWTPPAPGTWSLTAVATDSAQQTVLSEPVQVAVQPRKIAVAGTLYVDLRATNASDWFWTNWGALGHFSKHGPKTRFQTLGSIPSLDHRMFITNSFIGPNTVPDLEGSSDRSVEVWAWLPSGSGGASSHPTMVSWSYLDGASNTFMSVNYGTDLYKGAAAHGGPAYDLGWDSATNFPAWSAWHHFVYTYDGGVECRLYVDGALRCLRSLPGPLQTHASTPILLFGSCSAPGEPAEGPTRFLGYINAVRIHGGMLNASQVSNNFAAGPSVADFSSQIQAVGMSNGVFSFSYNTIPGRSYQIDCLTPYPPFDWTPLAAPQTAFGSSTTASDPTGGNPGRFYRVKLQP